MNDFQKYLEVALSKIDINDFAKEDSKKVESNDIDNALRNKLINYRNKIHMTQKELANLSKVSQANISKFENGTYHPSLKVLERIANAMGKKLVFNLL